MYRYPDVTTGHLHKTLDRSTDSPDGSRFVERLLTVRATLRQQQRNVLEYLTAACEAALHRRRPPSLLPVSKPTQA